MKSLENNSLSYYTCCAFFSKWPWNCNVTNVANCSCTTYCYFSACYNTELGSSWYHAGPPMIFASNDKFVCVPYQRCICASWICCCTYCNYVSDNGVNWNPQQFCVCNPFWSAPCGNPCFMAGNLNYCNSYLVGCYCGNGGMHLTAHLASSWAASKACCYYPIPVHTGADATCVCSRLMFAKVKDGIFQPLCEWSTSSYGQCAWTSGGTPWICCGTDTYYWQGCFYTTCDMWSGCLCACNCSFTPGTCIAINCWCPTGNTPPQVYTACETMISGVTRGSTPPYCSIFYSCCCYNCYNYGDIICLKMFYTDPVNGFNIICTYTSPPLNCSPCLTCGCACAYSTYSAAVQSNKPGYFHSAGIPKPQCVNSYVMAWPCCICCWYCGANTTTGAGPHSTSPCFFAANLGAWNYNCNCNWYNQGTSVNTCGPTSGIPGVIRFLGGLCNCSSNCWCCYGYLCFCGYEFPLSCFCMPTQCVYSYNWCACCGVNLATACIPNVFQPSISNYGICGAIAVPNTSYHIALTTGMGTLYTCNYGNTINRFTGTGSNTTGQIATQAGTMLSNCNGIVVVLPTCGNTINWTCTCGCIWCSATLPFTGCWSHPIGYSPISDRRPNTGTYCSLMYAFDSLSCCGVISCDGVNWSTICLRDPKVFCFDGRYGNTCWLEAASNGSFILSATSNGQISIYNTKYCKLTTSW